MPAAVDCHNALSHAGRRFRKLVRQCCPDIFRHELLHFDSCWIDYAGKTEVGASAIRAGGVKKLAIRFLALLKTMLCNCCFLELYNLFRSLNSRDSNWCDIDDGSVDSLRFNLEPIEASGYRAADPFRHRPKPPLR